MTIALITNDDGIDAPGLRHLALVAREEGLDIVVAAPIREASGSSAAVTAVVQDRRILSEGRQLPGLDGVPAYAVAAAPGYIVLLALRGAFGDPPDLVLSGINIGGNTGRAIIHSGTVGAAMTGAINGRRAMAVSLDVRSGSGPHNWETAASLVPKLLPLLDTLPESTVLNVNVPDLPVGELRGVKQATLGGFGEVQMTVAERGTGYVRTAIEETKPEHRPGTDMALLGEGYAAVTPVTTMTEAHIALAL